MSDTDLNLAELRAIALHDDFSTAKYAAIADQQINVAYREVIRTTSIAGAVLQTTVTTVPGDVSALPADNILVIELRRQNLPLTPMDVEDLKTLPVSSGPPQAYAIDGIDVRFWPAPSVAEDLQLDFRQAPAWLAGDDDKPTLLPNDYRPMIAWRARSVMFAFEDDPEMQTFWRGMADAELVKLRGDLQRRTRHNRRVPGTWSTLETVAQFHHPDGLF